MPRGEIGPDGCYSRQKLITPFFLYFREFKKFKKEFEVLLWEACGSFFLFSPDAAENAKAFDKIKFFEYAAKRYEDA